MHCNITYSICRRNDMEQSKDKIISDLFEKWNNFKHTLGHELVELIFKK